MLGVDALEAVAHVLLGADHFLARRFSPLLFMVVDAVVQLRQAVELTENVVTAAAADFSDGEFKFAVALETAFLILLWGTI